MQNRGMILNSVLAQQELKSEYLENQSKTIFMLKGLPRVRGRLGMKWNRIKDVIIKAKLCLDIDIERVHRVKRRKEKGSANANEPRTKCRLRDWKKREHVQRKTRKEKPVGFHFVISEDVALSGKIACNILYSIA